MELSIDSLSDIQIYIAAVLFPSILLVCLQQLCVSPLNQDKGALPLRISILIALSCDITLIILNRYRFTIDISIASDAISWTLLFALSFAIYKMVDTPRHYADQHWGVCLVKSWMFVTILYCLWLFTFLFLFLSKYGDLSWFPMRCRIGFDSYIVMGSMTVLIVSMNVWSTLNDSIHTHIGRTSTKEPVSCSSPQSRTAISPSANGLGGSTPNTMNTMTGSPPSPMMSQFPSQMTNQMTNQMTSPSLQMSEMNGSNGFSPTTATTATSTPQMTATATMSANSSFTFPRSNSVDKRKEDPQRALVQLSRGKRKMRWTATISLLFIFNSIVDITVISVYLSYPDHTVNDNISLPDFSQHFHFIFELLLYISVLLKHWISCSQIASHRSMYSMIRK